MVGIEKTQQYAINGNYASGYAGANFAGVGAVQKAFDYQTLVGVVTAIQPIDILDQSFSGFYEKIYSQDYYNRIWLIPRLISFGEISATVLRQAFLWNSYLQTVLLTDIQEIQTENIVLGGLSLSQTIAPLQVVLPFFTTNEQGPESVNATYTFSFTLGSPVSISLVGTRSEGWPFKVNWNQPYVADYEFRTDEITSRSGKSQRRAVRNNPRRAITYSATLVNYETRKLAGLMAKRQSRALTISDDSCSVSVGQPLLIGNSTVSLQYVPEWLEIGETYEVKSKAGSERKEVVSISGNIISWDAGYALSHGKDVKIKKIVPVLLTTDLRADRVTDGTSNVSFSFIIPPGEEKTWPTGDLEPLYEGKETWIRKPNWINGLSLNYIYPREELDYGRGINNYNYPINFGTQGRTLLNTCFDYEEIERVVNFFRRQKGRLGEFWVPSWEVDFVLLQDILIGTNSLLVEGVDLVRYYETDTVHKRIYIQKKDGTFEFKRVTSISLQGSDSFITLSDNFSQTILLQDIRKIGWLLLSRFASDTLSVSMVTDNKAQILLPILSLEVL